MAHKGIPKALRLRSIKHCQGDRAEALHAAYREGGMTMTAQAQQAQQSVSHISRLMVQPENPGR